MNIYRWREIQKRRSNWPNRQDRPSFKKAEEAMYCCEQLTVVSRDFRKEGEKAVVKTFGWSVPVTPESSEESYSPPLVSPMQTAYINTKTLPFARPHIKKWMSDAKTAEVPMSVSLNPLSLSWLMM